MRSIDTIWQEYHHRLFEFIKRKVGEDSAEDILQDVFIKLHSHIDSLKENERLEGWLFTMTRNTIVDYYRSNKVTEALPEWIEQKHPKNEEIIHRELSHCLVPMIEMLPDKYRKVIQLSELEGKTQREVAELENLSLSGAKSRVQRGRKRLKNIFNTCCEIELNRNNQLISYDTKQVKNKIC